MLENKTLFLDALKSALKNETVQWTEDIPVEQWMQLFQQARIHHILPMIFEAVYDCPSAKGLPPKMVLPMKYQVVQDVTVQAMKTHGVLDLYAYLEKNGIRPIVMKGMICRSIYPKPDHRLSGDEDLLIPANQFQNCHQLLLDYGMQLSTPTIDLENSYEVAYGKAGSPIYIEIHKSLFPPESEAYGDFNRFFENVFERAVTIDIEGHSVYTMSYTDHLFYLICHAFKHFLHSGFGIRQVCDMVMFGKTYGKEIQWDVVYKQCQEIRADLFATALFQIGQKYFDFSPEEACMTKEWFQMEIDETALLEDLLCGGVYGSADVSRLHSSNITLQAVSAHKRGKKPKGNLMKTLFPERKALATKYPYVNRYPFLLPVAWFSRIWHYSKELKVTKGSAAETIQVGNQRVELLKQYKIIQ